MNNGAEKRSERVIIALDLPGYDSAAAMVESLGESAVYYKVGLELFIRDGRRVLDMLESAGKKVFLDLKLHDIPNTVARSVDSIISAGAAAMTTLHTMGGFEMMRRAREAVDNSGDGLKLLGVTVLTSIDEDTLRDNLSIKDSIPKLVRNLATVAGRAGLHGVVASALELSLLREHFTDQFIIVTPGIRPSWAAKDDQKRVVTPKEAFDRGASYIVIGRPVTADTSPPDAFKRLTDELE